MRFSIVVLNYLLNFATENRNKVLEMFNARFDYDEWDRDYPKLKNMFNVLVDELLAQELTDHDLEMVAMCLWNTIHGDIA